MTTKQLEKIYQTACDAKGFTPSDGQFKIWKQVLGWCDEKDLQAALVKFYETNTGFPMPADLRQITGSIARVRQATAAAEKIKVSWECPECFARIGGFVPVGSDLERRCKGIPHRRCADGKHIEPIPGAMVKGPCGARMNFEIIPSSQTQYECAREFV